MEFFFLMISGTWDSTCLSVIPVVLASGAAMRHVTMLRRKQKPKKSTKEKKKMRAKDKERPGTCIHMVTDDMATSI